MCDLEHRKLETLLAKSLQCLLVFSFWVQLETLCRLALNERAAWFILMLSSRLFVRLSRRVRLQFSPVGSDLLKAFFCDVVCPIKAAASWIPRPSFPLSLYLSQCWQRLKADTELGFIHSDDPTLCWAETGAETEPKQLEDRDSVPSQLFTLKLFGDD